MKTRFISFFLFMLAMSCFVACSDDDPATDPEPEPELEPVETVNTYTYSLFPQVPVPAPVRDQWPDHRHYMPQNNSLPT